MIWIIILLTIFKIYNKIKKTLITFKMTLVKLNKKLIL